MKRVEPLIALELPAEAHSAKVARDAVAGLDGHLGLDASEPVQLSVGVEGDTVRVAVRDPGPGFEPPGAPTDPAHVGGWGLVLVDQLAERWGVDREDDANVVWCELKR